MENTSNNNNEYTVILINNNNNNNNNDNDEEAATSEEEAATSEEEVAASDEVAQTVESNWCCNKRCGMFVVGVVVVVLMAPRILPYLPEPVPELLLGFLLLLVLVACLFIIDAGFLRNGEMYIPPGGYYSRYF